MSEAYDVGTAGLWPGNQLNIMARNAFVYDGVRCNSLVGIFQSLKFGSPSRQAEVCRMVGREAQAEGENCHRSWKLTAKLFWMGQKFDRHGQPYQEFLNEVFLAVSRNGEFRNALMATRDAVLIDSTLEKSPYKTVITSDEFRGRLMMLRAVIKKHYEGEEPKIVVPKNMRN